MTNSISKEFGKFVFNRHVMQKMLPKEVVTNLINAADGREKIKLEFADQIASAMREWATGLGATHYSHWFLPLTGSSAEKHDSFLDWHEPDVMIERFTGKKLIQGEPDASSFPSGGLRSTFEARGYTGWDPTSPAFVWKAGDGITLCIPSVYFSWTGHVLDNKIPLLRSEKRLDEVGKRLLKLVGLSCNLVFSTIGLEQEYFLIDRMIYNLRPDLSIIGRTVFGAMPPKGQELQDHYFRPVKDKILSFMHELESNAILLGIPIKTRHNEVAPSQFELAPSVEKASTAIDHNIQMMELMRQTAANHDLACLLHEKPFAKFNGSGKHCNWSLATDTGINLLDPTDTPETCLHYLILLTAIMHAVHEHSVLLRASIGSASNDYRLGGHEAPPAIISVFLGEALESVFNNIENGVSVTTGARSIYDLGIFHLPDLSKDHTDRNRTSPFAFTGNKFEFRALGSSANPGFSVTVLNVIVADSLNKILNEIEASLNGKPNEEKKFEAALPVLRKYLKASKNIRFNGDNYSKEWQLEAKKRKLPNLEKSIDAFEVLLNKNCIEAFSGILSEEELKSRYDVMLEFYSTNSDIETNLMLDLFRTYILPAAEKQQRNLAESISATTHITKTRLPQQTARLKNYALNIEKGIRLADDLEKMQIKASQQKTLKLKAHAYCNLVLPKGEQLRNVVDEIESMTENSLWPLPRYQEMLFTD